MTVENMIRYLRSSISIQDPTVTVQDQEYLSMTDEDILLYLNVVLTRDFSEVVSLDIMPSENVYPLMLLAKKELYYALATKGAPLYDIGADNNNYLKRSQRFDHYMKLIVQTDKEYSDYLDKGGAGGNTLVSHDVLLSDRYATKRNYEKGAIPSLILYTGEVTSTSIEVLWTVKNLSRFFSYKVYISTSPVLDTFNISNKISTESKEVAVIKDVHQRKCRITGLLPDTQYYIAVSASALSSLTGYAELSVTTEA